MTVVGWVVLGVAAVAGFWGSSLTYTYCRDAKLWEIMHGQRKVRACQLMTPLERIEKAERDANHQATLNRWPVVKR